MKIPKWSALLAACTSCFMMFEPALGAEPTAEQRSTARIYARIETLLASRDQNGYCNAFHGSEDYRGYVGRACQAGVKAGVRKIEQCTALAVTAEVETDRKKCLAMDGAAFEATISKQSEARGRFVKALAGNGIDGKKLIAEEHAKLK